MQVNLLKAQGRTLASSDITTWFGQDAKFQIVSIWTFEEGFSKMFNSGVSRLLFKMAVKLWLDQIKSKLCNSVKIEEPLDYR